MKHLLEQFSQHQASDLHLLEDRPPMARRDGELQPIRETVLNRRELSEFLKPITGRDGWQRLEREGELDFLCEHAGERFRGNAFRHIRGLGVVFRRIARKIPTLEELNLPATLRRFCELDSGLVIVTGATGSGKSTTLAAMIHDMNTRFARHIVTLEEPVEFFHSNLKSIVTHREIPADTPTFADGLRAVLREDAEVVLIGDMRSAETMDLALKAAETGMLVFGTLHTNNASRAVERILQSFPIEEQTQLRTRLSQTLRGVCSQTLLKRKDAAGRLPVNEILMVDHAISAMIRDGNTTRMMDAMRMGRERGMVCMDDAILECLRKGQVSAGDAYLKATEKPRFLSYL